MNPIERIKALPPEQRVLAEKKFKAELFKRSLGLTAKQLLGYKDITPRTHFEVVCALEAETKRKLIVMPRGTFKSSLCSVSYSIWQILCNPDVRILLDGELYTNSSNFLREIKQHLENPAVIELFGEFKSDCWRESEIIVKQRTKILKEATITAGGIGTEKTGQHYDIIICDDLNSPKNSGTKEGLEKVIQHYRYNLSILEPNGILVVVGTRYAEMDAIGYIMQREIDD